MAHRIGRRALVIVGVAGLMTMGASAAARAQDEPPTRFMQHDLVSDVPGRAEITDPSLVNAWGMSQSPTSPIWVSDNGPNVSTLYRTDGPDPVTKVPLTVSLPGEGVTGQVFNPTTGFVVSAGGVQRSSVFIFDTESGDVAGWNPAVPPPPPSPSTVAQVGAHVEGAVFKGLAIVQDAAGAHLLAADFHGGQIDVFDSTWQQVQLSGSFTDPDLPAGYGPFNVATLGGQVYVAYAKQDADHEDEIAGQGRGFVDVFDLSGNFLRRLASHGQLNAPWGLALAPAGFGDLAGSLLVGNFGDGRINAYDPTTGEYLGALRDEAGQRIEIDGLWALMFGNGVTAPATTLLFTAGPDEESHGLFGTLTVAPAKHDD
jgi:uncharacterized protein (TIGR03118 family)